MGLSAAGRLRTKSSSGAGSFDPSTVTGLIRWWKADGNLFQDTAGSTPAVADGDPVGYWTDSSSTADHAKQGTAGQRPLLKTGANGINGVRAVLFDGVDDRLVSAAGIVAKPFTAFAVLKPTTIAASRTILGSTAAGGAQWRVDAGSGGKMDLVSQGTVDIGLSSGTVTAATAVLVAVSYSGTGVYAHRINRAASGGATNNQTMANNTTFVVGTNGATGEQMLGLIGEILVYNNVVAGSDITNIENYLSFKWSTP